MAVRFDPGQVVLSDGVRRDSLPGNVRLNETVEEVRRRDLKILQRGEFLLPVKVNESGYTLLDMLAVGDDY